MKLSVSFLNNILSSLTQRVHLRWTVSYDPEGPPYTVCDGTLDISLSFSGHFILVCLNSKQAPVESLY